VCLAAPTEHANCAVHRALTPHPEPAHRAAVQSGRMAAINSKPGDRAIRVIDRRIDTVVVRPARGHVAHGIAISSSTRHQASAAEMIDGVSPPHHPGASWWADPMAIAD
jgi:hypothetical protein